jgi:K+-sensing histidine kinase KdpD
MWFRVAVKDTGSGIAPEELHLVFEPFSKLSFASEFAGKRKSLVLRSLRDY